MRGGEGRGGEGRGEGRGGEGRGRGGEGRGGEGKAAGAGQRAERAESRGQNWVALRQRGLKRRRLGFRVGGMKDSLYKDSDLGFGIPHLAPSHRWSSLSSTQVHGLEL